MIEIVHSSPLELEDIDKRQLGVIEMLKRRWIISAFLICGLVSGCSHNAGTLAENDPFHGKDPFQALADQSKTSNNTGVASLNATPPPANTQWNTADGWRSKPHVTHPEFNYERGQSMANSQVTMSDHSYSSAQKPSSAIRNAEYVVAKPVTAEAQIQIVAAEESRPKITVRDGLRFIETTENTDDSPELREASSAKMLTKEIPPFVDEEIASGGNSTFEANPFEDEPSREYVPDRTPEASTPEWWNE